MAGSLLFGTHKQPSDYNGEKLTIGRSRKGLSMAAFNPVVLGVHMRINEKAVAAEVKKTA
jgi:hypothetical protein